MITIFVFILTTTFSLLLLPSNGSLNSFDGDPGSEHGPIWNPNFDDQEIDFDDEEEDEIDLGDEYDHNNVISEEQDQEQSEEWHPTLPDIWRIEDNTNYTNNFTSRVSNGEVVKSTGNFPSVVWLPDLACGGAILNSYYVVTAAHCLVETMKIGDNREETLLIDIHSKQYYNVRTGMINRGESNQLPKESTVQQVIMKRIEIHPNYDPNTKENDIAVIQLCRPFNLNNGNSPKSINIGRRLAQLQDTANVVGWGIATKLNPSEKNSAIRPNSQLLRQAEQRLFGPKECKPLFQQYTYKGNSDYTNLVRKCANFIFDTQICGLEVHSGQGQCKGDSGGPLYCYTKDGGVQVLCGIVSFGPACGFDGVPGVYTSFYEDSIWNWLTGALQRTTCNNLPSSKMKFPKRKCSLRTNSPCE